GHVDRVGAVFPRPHRASRSERVAARAPERVPVADGEAQVLLHRLAFDFFVRIVMAETERVDGVRALVTNLANFRKKRHRAPGRGSSYRRASATSFPRPKCS